MKKFIFIIFGLATFSFSLKENKTMSKDKNEFVPQWAKMVVWYQIFPERFHNGDKNNDPTIRDIEGAYPHNVTSPWQIHPWTSDWYELQPYEKQNGKDIWFNLQRRRYGGDLQGIIDKLDYLQELGITALYLNPIFEAPSLHKYDGATFHHIDPNFGSNPSGDRELIKKEIPDDPSTWAWTSADKLFLELIKQVHQRKMYIILDGVFNHMGLNSWAFKDVVKNQQNSKYKDWFTIKSWDDPKTGERFKYEGWFGVKELPELREDKNGIVAGPKKYIFDITKRWMDPDNDGNPEDGIDGWRLDVAYCVKHPFWKDWRKEVRSINPEAYLTAEVIDSIKVIKPYLEGDEFDAVMNYNFAFACADYFVNDKTRIETSKFDTMLKELREAFPGGVEYVQQNLFDSHDTNRLLSHIVNRDLGNFKDWPKYYDVSRGSNPKYSTRKPGDYEIIIAKLFVIFQMTYLGAPMVYYGDEVGMWGANDPDCRKPMVWADMKYDDEVYLPNQTKKTEPDKVESNNDLREHYKKLIGIRNENPALQLGDFETILTDNTKELYAFSRNYKNEKIIVVFNNSTQKHTAEIITPASTKWTDLLNENVVYETSKSKIKFDVPAKWGMILKLD
jgi:cyclomaltodextrinase / maltogenic alpha-amylase / neopullulanase